jgi:hypothetical protein
MEMKSQPKLSEEFTEDRPAELKWERHTDQSGDDLLVVTLGRPEGDRLLTIPVRDGRVPPNIPATGEGKDD